jgi:hypothetical protein
LQIRGKKHFSSDTLAFELRFRASGFAPYEAYRRQGLRQEKEMPVQFKKEKLRLR